MGDDTRLDELLTSPLDQPDSFRVWWPLIAGVALGIAGALAGYWIASSDPAPVAAGDVTSTTVTTTSLPDPGGDGEPVAYPTGFIEVADLVAVKPTAAVVYDGSVHVAFATAVRREFSATDATPFNGGRWVLVTSDGREVESAGVATSFNAPGSFTIVFPWESESPPDPATLRLVEGLNVYSGQDEAGVPYEGLPAAAVGIEAVELPGTTLVVDSIEVNEDEATISWSSSAGTPIDPSFTLSLVDSNQNSVAVWYLQTDGFFFGPIGEHPIPEQSSGSVTLPRDRGLQSSSDVAAGTSLRLFASANTAVPFPASAEFDVTELPVITR